MGQTTFTLVQKIDDPHDRIFAAVVALAINDYLAYQRGRIPRYATSRDGPKARQFLVDLELLDDAGEVIVPERRV